MTWFSFLETWMTPIFQFFQEFPLFGLWYTTVVRWMLPILAILILVKSIRSLLQVENSAEIWAYLSLPNGVHMPLTHWENLLGRAKSADVVLNFPSISRNHCTLIRNDTAEWIVTDLGSKGGTMVNGEAVEGEAEIRLGDTLTLAGVEMMLLAIPPKEKRQNVRERYREGRPVSPWSSLVFLTVFQVLLTLQLIIALGSDCPAELPGDLFPVDRCDLGVLFDFAILAACRF